LFSKRAWCAPRGVVEDSGGGVGNFSAQSAIGRRRDIMLRAD
jgi:hypothetical protein